MIVVFPFSSVNDKGLLRIMLLQIVKIGKFIENKFSYKIHNTHLKLLN